jgi:hypothetical protein
MGGGGVDGHVCWISSFTICRLPTKENKLPFSVFSKQMYVCRFRFPFAANKRKLPFSVSPFFCVCACVYIYIYIYVYIHIYIYIIFILILLYLYLNLNGVVWNGKVKMEAQAIFLNQLTVCSLCKQKIVVCLFVVEETSGSYPFANGLNGVNGLPHLWE